jgi:tRNA/tmRNA/rRNA uracil-C5-methylase (TrmA/RlmC/RlmD family)
VAEILYNQVVQELRGGLTNPTNPSTTEDPTDAPALAPPSPPLLCLDICCGTGTIGIICSKANLGSVVGIEMCAAAVENAKLNAQLNGLTLLSDTQPAEATSGNEAAFVCSKAETVLENILTDHRRTQDPLIQRVQYLARGKKLLAVVDPPREVMTLPSF